MTLETMIGARLAVGIPGPEATDEVIAALRRIHAQSLVVFTRNFTSPEQFTQLRQTLEEALGYRLLIMVDHEGGRVVRFESGVTLFPSALTQASRGPEAIEQQGSTEADELKRLGVCVNLAPCVDVIVPEADPIIGDRSYGHEPSLVSALAVARIRGLQSHGVAACAKHFPGLGAVPRDPHKVLPTIHLDWPAMERVHLVPFQAAVDAGVATIMSSHVCYPALADPPGLPATFSRHLINELLRARLGFAGVILTDDLEMGALRTFGDMGQAAIRATEAGHDILLICSDLAQAEEALSVLQKAYRAGDLSRLELEQSVKRIDALKKKFLL